MIGTLTSGVGAADLSQIVKNKDIFEKAQKRDQTGTNWYNKL
jgi:hypothetical protein